MEFDLTILKSLKIYQPKNGYRFSLEPFILTDSIQNQKHTIIDFGSGCGIIAILLAKQNPESVIYAVEQNAVMLKLIEKNIKINNIHNIIIDNICDIKNNSADLIISNPPYFTEQSYRVSKRFFNERFETQPINTVLQSFKKVAKNKGLLRMSYHPTRLIEAAEKLNFYGFGIKNITPVYGAKNKDAVFTIIDSRFNTNNYSVLKKAIYLEEFLKN